MNLVQRVQDILLKPRDTWQTIAQEPSDVPGLFKNYVVYLAAVSSLATFIGLSLVGVGGFGMSFRVPIVTGLVNLVVGFVLTLVMVYVLGLIANALAPTFQGEKNLPNAVKLVAYGSTAGLLGGIFNLLPALSMLGLLAALYSIYLIYTGIPVMMKAPEGKAVGYTAVLILCGVVAGLVMGAVSALFTGGGPGMMGHMGRSDGNVTFKVPGSEVTVDTAKLEEAARKMEEAGKKMEEAQARGDQAGANKALGEMMGAALGGAGRQALDTGCAAAVCAREAGGHVPAISGGTVRSGHGHEFFQRVSRLRQGRSGCRVAGAGHWRGTGPDHGHGCVGLLDGQSRDPG